MKNKKRLKAFVGILLLIVIIAIHLYVAANYYFLESRKLTDFFIWQSDATPDTIEK